MLVPPHTFRMTVLLVVGVGVVVLGALILLLFPDRPGGRIAWQGIEVSSIGAGLPLIVVGIVAIGLSGGGVVGGGGGDGTSGTGQKSAKLKCPDDLEASLPPERIANVEVGADGQIVVGPAASKTPSFGLRFTDGGDTVGAITARFFPASNVFKIQTVVDADCRAGKIVSLEGGGVIPDTIPNYRNVRIDFMGRSYLLNLGGGSDIRLNFYNFVP
jgi:hypothetical protein